MLKNVNGSNNPITSFSGNVCNGTGEVWLKTQPYLQKPTITRKSLSTSIAYTSWWTVTSFYRGLDSFGLFRTPARNAFPSFHKNFARMIMQTVPPTQTVIIILVSYFRRGGNTASPPLAKAPSTQTTDITKRKEAIMRDLLTDLTTLPIKASSRLGMVASAPATTAAMAKKKERLLNTQKALTFGFCLIAA